MRRQRVLASTCDNDVLDPNETDVDCGGVCAPCANGLDCDGGADCSSTICVDGVCCGTACIGVCVACSAIKKGGGADGVCGSVANDTDPDGECIGAPASTCGLDGFCNGAGRACSIQRDVSGRHLSAERHTSTPQRHLDACKATTPCTPYVCGVTACNTTCAGDVDCAAGNYCAAPTCLPQKADGAACGGDSECQNGVCAANVCRPAHCGDGDLDAGTESDTDCGLECVRPAPPATIAPSPAIARRR